MKSSVDLDQKVTLEGVGDEDPKEHRAPEGNPAQQDLLVNMDQ